MALADLISWLWPWIPLGLATGVLTTTAGLGGGMLLVLALTALRGPAQALAVSALGLLLGNIHRLWIDRRELDPRLARAFVVGALPGSFLGGMLALGMPEAVLRSVALVGAGFAIARELGWLSLTPGPRVIVPPRPPAGPSPPPRAEAACCSRRSCSPPGCVAGPWWPPARRPRWPSTWDGWPPTAWAAG
jgi:uncharacterized membrane protein YfcA